MTTDPVMTKLNKANVPDLGAMTPLAYYPGRDLLVVRGGLLRDWLYTINRQNLIRFFASDDELQGWLRRNGYEPIPEGELRESARDPFGTSPEVSADVLPGPGPALRLVER